MTVAQSIYIFPKTYKIIERLIFVKSWKKNMLIKNDLTKKLENADNFVLNHYDIIKNLSAKEIKSSEIAPKDPNKKHFITVLNWYGKNKHLFAI